MFSVVSTLIWIPAVAGMTFCSAGMTVRFAEITSRSMCERGRLPDGRGSDGVSSGFNVCLKCVVSEKGGPAGPGTECLRGDQAARPGPSECQMFANVTLLLPCQRAERPQTDGGDSRHACVSLMTTKSFCHQQYERGRETLQAFPKKYRKFSGGCHKVKLDY